MYPPAERNTCNSTDQRHAHKPCQSDTHTLWGVSGGRWRWRTGGWWRSVVTRGWRGVRICTTDLSTRMAATPVPHRAYLWMVGLVVHIHLRSVRNVGVRVPSVCTHPYAYLGSAKEVQIETAAAEVGLRCTGRGVGSQGNCCVDQEGVNAVPWHHTNTCVPVRLSSRGTPRTRAPARKLRLRVTAD